MFCIDPHLYFVVVIFEFVLFIVRKLGEGTAALARGVAPHLREGGEKILPKSFTASDPNGRSRMDDVAEVAASGLKSKSTFFIPRPTRWGPGVLASPRMSVRLAVRLAFGCPHFVSEAELGNPHIP